MPTIRPNPCEGCGAALEPRRPRIHLCFRCWFMLDQLAFRDASRQVGQLPLRFSLTRFAATPRWVPRSRKTIVSRVSPEPRELVRRSQTTGADSAQVRPIRRPIAEPEQLALPYLLVG